MSQRVKEQRKTAQHEEIRGKPAGYALHTLLQLQTASQVIIAQQPSWINRGRSAEVCDRTLTPDRGRGSTEDQEQRHPGDSKGLPAARYAASDSYRSADRVQNLVLGEYDVG